jgi:glyoxylase-like metal-dependent hydrolase (beta-lactamase superfamily II)
MGTKRESQLISRRELLQTTAVIAGSTAFAQFFPAALRARAAALPWPSYPQQGGAPADPVAAMRAQMAAAPMETHKLADNLTMFGGPGGNVVALNGTDGKFIVDTFVKPVWPKLKAALDGLGNAPLKLVIDTHWHFDRTDNNEAFHEAGAAILAHENTKTRLTESHDLLGMHFGPSPAAALPTETFKAMKQLQANGENMTLAHLAPAHTDTDIYVHYQKANVLHCGDVFFNGMYPFIDAGTGGGINGMIAASTKLLAMADSNTKIVPGHGPLGDKAALAKYRDMLSTVRDRVQKQKSAGKKLEEVVAAKPTADLDAVWGKGLIPGDVFVTIVYNTL